MSRVRAVSFVFAFAALFLFAGCKAKVGDKCTSGQASCADPAGALICGSDSKLATMPCRGPKGCAATSQSLLCDNSFARENDTCNEPDDFACSIDKKSALTCKGGKFVVGETCKGTHGCEVKGDKITCDNDVADVNDPCMATGPDYACTPGGSPTLLICTDHKMIPLNSCRGTKGCRIIELPQEKKIEFFCDDSVAQANDACDEENEHACSMDKKAIFICTAHKFVAFKGCPGPTGCSFDEKGEKFTCDTTSSTGKPVNVTKPAAPAVPQKPAKKGK